MEFLIRVEGVDRAATRAFSQLAFLAAYTAILYFLIGSAPSGVTEEGRDGHFPGEVEGFGRFRPGSGEPTIYKRFHWP